MSIFRNTRHSRKSNLCDQSIIPIERKQYYTIRRLKVMEKLGGAICQNCGCDDIRILEINHKNGGGHQERKGKNTRTNATLLTEILYDKVPTEDYNVLCKVCNIQHYVETILGITGHKIIWKFVENDK